MKNVILSFASTYSYCELQAFVESWKANASNVDLYLFYIDISKWTMNCLRNMGVNLVEAPIKYKDLYEENNRKIVMYIRMEMFNDFLVKHLGEYNSVLVSDVRDVIIQEDPFLDVPQQEYLRFSSEGTSILSNNLNASWIDRLTGSEAWRKEFGERETVNAGIYMGTLREIIEFQTKIISMAPYDKFWGADQASVNCLVHTGKLSLKNVIYDRPDSGSIVTIYFYQDDYKIENNSVVNKKNKIVSVLHQYDRVPRLVEFIDSTYRKVIFDDSILYSDLRSNLEMIKTYVCCQMYQKALEKLLSLKEVEMEYCPYPLIISIAKDIFSKCNLLTDEIIVSFICHLTWDKITDMFKQMSTDDKIISFDAYIDLLNNNKLISPQGEERFTQYVWELFIQSVQEKRWHDAYLLLRKYGWKMKKIGCNFYLLSSEVYHQLNCISESIKNYSVGCIMQQTTIYYLKCIFSSYIFIKENILHQVYVNNPDETCRGVMGQYPLCAIEKNGLIYLFVFIRDKFLYVQQVKNDGSVFLGDLPKAFKVLSGRDDIVSIQTEENVFLSALPNGNFKSEKWARAWEQFKKIPVTMPDVYYRTEMNEKEIY